MLKKDFSNLKNLNEESYNIFFGQMTYILTKIIETKLNLKSKWIDDSIILGVTFEKDEIILKV